MQRLRRTSHLQSNSEIVTVNRYSKYVILILLCFRIKKFSEGIFNSDMCYRYDSWCRTIQGVMSNRYRTSRFSNFEIIRAITP